MSQQTVYDFLEKNRGKWFTVLQISRGINVSVGAVWSSVSVLRRRGDVLFKSEKNTRYRAAIYYSVR